MPTERGEWHGPSAATAVVGVMGDPVAHSLSPSLHNAAFAALAMDWVSVGFPVSRGGAAGAMEGIRALGIRGLSVTMPHKEAVARLVDRLTPSAEALGAVNCVVRDGDRLVGENTDGEGFLAALRRAAGFVPAGRRCVVVGAGGAGRAVVAALAGAGAAEVTVVNRSRSRGERAAALAGSVGRSIGGDDAARLDLDGVDLVVEATPTGMAGTDAVDAAPLIAADRLGPGQIAVDLVYHPAETPWLGGATRAGAVAVGGLGMLVHQAAAQIDRWTGREPPVAAMWAAVAGASGAPPQPGRRGADRRGR